MSKGEVIHTSDQEHFNIEKGISTLNDGTKVLDKGKTLSAEETAIIRDMSEAGSKGAIEDMFNTYGIDMPTFEKQMGAYIDDVNNFNKNKDWNTDITYTRYEKIADMVGGQGSVKDPQSLVDLMYNEAEQAEIAERRVEQYKEINGELGDLEGEIVSNEEPQSFLSEEGIGNITQKKDTTIVEVEGEETEDIITQVESGKEGEISYEDQVAINDEFVEDADEYFEELDYTDATNKEAFQVDGNAEYDVNGEILGKELIPSTFEKSTFKPIENKDYTIDQGIINLSGSNKKETFYKILEENPHVLISMGASWCGPCGKQKDYYKKEKPADVPMVYIDKDTDIDVWNEFTKNADSLYRGLANQYSNALPVNILVSNRNNGGDIVSKPLYSDGAALDVQDYEHINSLVA